MSRICQPLQLFLTLCFAAVAAKAAPAATDTAQIRGSSCSFALRGAQVWTGTGFAKRDLAIHGGKFVAESSASDPIIDASWLWLTPPLADAHTHTVDRASTLDDPFHNKQVESGVFYAFNANSLMPLSRKPVLRGASLVDVVFAGAGITRPGGHPRPLYERLANNRQLGGVQVAELAGLAFHEADTTAAAVAAVQRVARSGVAFVKLYLSLHGTEKSAGLTAPAFRAAAAEARRIGLRAVVHIDSAADFRLAIEVQAHALMHLPASALDESLPDSVYLIAAADAAAARKAGTIVVPTVAPPFYYLSGKPLARQQKIMAANLALLQTAGVPLAAGADIYTKSSLDELNLLRATGLFDGGELLNIGTTNGLKLMLPNRNVGTFETGAEASFIGYYADPRDNWYVLGEPLFGVREGDVLIDKAKLLGETCARSAS
jgi:imidazolonepropionase-like amidohydrolase